MEVLRIGRYYRTHVDLVIGQFAASIALTKFTMLFLQKLLDFLLLETRDQEVVGGYLDIRIDRCLDVSYLLPRLA